MLDPGQELAPAAVMKEGEVPAFTVITAEPEIGLTVALVLSFTETKVYVEVTLGATDMFAPEV